MRKGEVRRQSIIEASERLFSAKGYLETTVDDILTELQCSKGSFYHYFDSKLSVLTAICEEKVRLWFDAYKKTRVTSTRERLNVLLKLQTEPIPIVAAIGAQMRRLYAAGGRGFSVHAASPALPRRMRGDGGRAARRSA